jgi:hypothetical protein
MSFTAVKPMSSGNHIAWPQSSIFGQATRPAHGLELAAEACNSVGLNPGDTLGR